MGLLLWVSTFLQMGFGESSKSLIISQWVSFRTRFVHAGYYPKSLKSLGLSAAGFAFLELTVLLIGAMPVGYMSSLRWR
jgi:hypothetical protein